MKKNWNKQQKVQFLCDEIMCRPETFIVFGKIFESPKHMNDYHMKQTHKVLDGIWERIVNPMSEKVDSDVDK